jgi:hypothetical protein
MCPLLDDRPTEPRLPGIDQVITGVGRVIVGAPLGIARLTDSPCQCAAAGAWVIADLLCAWSTCSRYRRANGE